eukprot:14366960-Alexandrium_andersonii.AAC.1
MRLPSLAGGLGAMRLCSVRVRAEAPCPTPTAKTSGTPSRAEVARRSLDGLAWRDQPPLPLLLARTLRE